VGGFSRTRRSKLRLGDASHRSAAAARSAAAYSRLAAAAAAARMLEVVERLEEEDEWRDMATDWDGVRVEPR